MKNFNKVLLVSVLTFFWLSACKSQVQEYPYEFAKKHVWGDKVNGCDYQTIGFYNNTFVRKSSRKMIDRIKKINPSIIISENDMLRYYKVESNKDNFKLHFNRDNVYTYKIIDNVLQFYSTDKYAKDKIRIRNNKAYPTDFVICA